MAPDLRPELGPDRLGDRLNPILVKEARQAMKSRQFVVTFSLLLICGWLWTVLFVVSGLPAIFFAPVGPGVLVGYYVVLSVPLLIVVPYAAFRSLAGEWEDGTFEFGMSIPGGMDQSHPNRSTSREVLPSGSSWRATR